MNATRSVMQGEITDPERSHLANSEPGLQHELDKRIIAPGQTMG
jgi:hypothetical protein